MAFVNFTSYAANPQFQIPALLGHHATGSTASVAAAIPPAAIRPGYPPTGVRALTTESMSLPTVQLTAAFSRQVAPLLKQAHQARAVATPVAPRPMEAVPRYAQFTQRAPDHSSFFPGSYASRR